MRTHTQRDVSRSTYGYVVHMCTYAHIIKVVISVKYTVKEQDKKKSFSQSSPLIYLCKILCLCIITELKVELGDKTTGATTKDSKHNTVFLSVLIQSEGN